MGRFCRPGADGGFNLLELSIALFLSLVWIGVTVPVFLPVLSQQELVSTRETLIDNLRYAQEIGQTSGTFGSVRMARYQPFYSTYVGGRLLARYPFPPGVNYADGWLQLNTGTLNYDQLGYCQIGGVIRLTDGRHELDVNLYQGVGLQALRE